MTVALWQPILARLCRKLEYWSERSTQLPGYYHSLGFDEMSGLYPEKINPIGEVTAIP